MQILSEIVSKDHTQFLVTALPNLSPPNHYHVGFKTEHRLKY
jgi:hypothetical protein